MVVQRLGQRPLDRGLRIGHRLEGVGGVHDARAERQLLEPHPLAEVEEDGRSVAVDLDDSSRTRHQTFKLLKSKATFTAPRRPALIAYAIASRYSPRPNSGPVSWSRCRAGAASSASSHVR